MKKILIVDDETALVRLIQLNLEATGRYQVKTETQGMEALNAARAFQPDLILLDVVMPGLSGPEVASQIRADKSLKHIPIVFLTAAVLKDGPASATDGPSEKGGIPLPFIAKPVSTMELIKHIEETLAGRVS